MYSDEPIFPHAESKGHYHVFYSGGVFLATTSNASNYVEHTHTIATVRGPIFVSIESGEEHFHKTDLLRNAPLVLKRSVARAESNHVRAAKNAESRANEGVSV